MQHVGQNVGIGAVWDALKEVPWHDLAAIGDTFRAEHPGSVGYYRWPVEQDATQMAVRLQDGGQQRALAAADVSHGPDRREVISGGNARREGRGPLRHSGLELLRQVRVRGKELKQAHPVCDV